MFLIQMSICLHNGNFNVTNGNFILFIFLKSENVALLMCSAIWVFDVRSDPDCPSRMTLYLYSFVILIVK